MSWRQRTWLIHVTNKTTFIFQNQASCHFSDTADALIICKNQSINAFLSPPPHDIVCSPSGFCSLNFFSSFFLLFLCHTTSPCSLFPNFSCCFCFSSFCTLLFSFVCLSSFFICFFCFFHLLLLLLFCLVLFFLFLWLLHCFVCFSSFI